MIRLVPERKAREWYEPDVLIVKAEPDVVEGEAAPAPSAGRSSERMAGRVSAAAAAAAVPAATLEPFEALLRDNVIEEIVPVFARAAEAAMPEGTRSPSAAISRSVRDVEDESDELRGVLRLKLRTGSDIEGAERRLRNTRGITRVERVGRRWAQARKAARRASAQPDPLSNRQWGLRAIKWFEAHPLPAVSGVRVAVLDTGVDTTHPDLSVLASRYRHSGLKAEDIVGHGTHVTGIISALVNNGVGIAGVCKPEIHVWKVFSDEPDADGEYYVDDLRELRALNAAVKAGVQVINLSIGGFAELEQEKVLIKKAIDAGVVVVVAMGNEYLEGNPIEYPAKYADEYPGVIAVGATNQYNRRASFSNTGKHITLCAPGASILSTLPMKPSAYRGSDETEYAAWDGTSMATPYVTAAAALVIAKSRRQVTPAEVALHVTTTATRGLEGMSGTRHSEVYGAGLLDLDAALSKAIRKSAKPGKAKKRKKTKTAGKSKKTTAAKKK